MRKINIDTDIPSLAMTGADAQVPGREPDKFDARDSSKPAAKRQTSLCKGRYIEFAGCEGQGAKIKGYSPEQMAQKARRRRSAQLVK